MVSPSKKGSLKIFIEGGGDSDLLRKRCREAFHEFIQKLGFQGNMPPLVACGGRREALDRFSTALNRGENAFLLIDSECKVDASHQSGAPENWQPWAHLLEHEGKEWAKPNHAEDSQCHFMVECMENWFLADRDALRVFFGQSLNENLLPSPKVQKDTTPDIETISKKEVLEKLETATGSNASKNAYKKGATSFRLLEKIDPKKVIRASPWARRFADTLKHEFAS